MSGHAAGCEQNAAVERGVWCEGGTDRWVEGWVLVDSGCQRAARGTGVGEGGTGCAGWASEAFKGGKVKAVK